MDSSELIAALPGRTEEIICLLFEAGAQPEEDFLAFKAEHEDRMHSLYIHPQLMGFQNYGPWLLEIDNAERLPDYLASWMCRSHCFRALCVFVGCAVIPGLHHCAAGWLN